MIIPIVKNNNNQFTVARVHYSLDPDKNTPEWLAEVKRGMPENGFRREYEIDYSFSSNEISFFFNEHESIATKPIFFTLIKTDNYANNIQILNALFTHTKILFTDIPSIKNTSFIE